MSRETLEELTSYLGKASVPVDKLVAIPEGSPFRQTLTPAIMLVGAAGQIERLWLGRLSPEQESEVMALFKTAAQ